MELKAKAKNFIFYHLLQTIFSTVGMITSSKTAYLENIHFYSVIVESTYKSLQGYNLSYSPFLLKYKKAFYAP